MAFDVNSTKIVITAEDKTAAGIESAKNSVSRLTAAYSALFEVIAGAVSIDMFVGMIKQTIDAADRLNDLSQSLGINLRELSKYQLATAQSGTSLEALGKGIKGITKAFSENGDELRAAGISAKNADGMIRQVAEIFAQMPDGIEKTTLATKLFGKSGMELIPMLNMGAAGLDEAAEKSAKYAAVMAVLAPQSDKFKDTLAELAMASKVASMSLISDALPAMQRIAAAMAIAAHESGNLKAAWMGWDRFVTEGLNGWGKTLHLFWARTNAYLDDAAAKMMRFLGASKEAAMFSNSANEYKLEMARILESNPATTPQAPKQLDTTAWMAKYKELMAALGGDKSKEIADNDSAYRNLVKTLKDKLLVDQEQTEVNRLNIALEALSAKQREAITPARATELKGLAEKVDLNKRLKETMENNAKNYEAQNKMEVEAAQAQAEYENKLGATIITKSDAILQMEFETKLIGLTNEQREKAIALRELETSGIDKESWAYTNLIERMNAAIGAKFAAQKADELRKQSLDEFNSLWSAVERTGKDVFTHVFSDGKTAFEGIGKAIKASVIDLLYQITAKKWIVSIGTSIAGSMGLSTAASAASTASTGSSLLSGGLMLGNLGASQTMADFGNFFGSVGSVAESGASFGVMDAISGFAMANPWTAAAAAVLALYSTGALDGIFGGNERTATPQMAGLGSNSTISRAGFAGQQWTASGSSPTDLWAGSVWEPLPAQYLTGFNNAVKAVFDGMETQAKAAGLSVDSLASLTVNMGATGYGVQKDLETALLATSDAIAENLMPNIRSLQVNGESLAQTFARVTTATIQAKTAEDARLAALATQQRSLEIALMEAQGDAAGALAAKREDELKALDASLKPLQEQIYAAQDLAKANEDAAKAQQDAAAAAQDVTRAQEEMVASMRETLSALVSQGQGIHNFLRGLGATGATGSLDTTRAAYLEDLAAARAGNADAYQRITQSAGDYIKAGQDMWASSSTQVDLVAQIKRELGGLSPVENLDKNIQLLTLIEASTKNTATATGNLDVLGIKAIFDLSQVITFVANSTGIPADLRKLITDQAQDYSVTLKAIDTDPSLTPTMKNVLFVGSGTYTAAARAIISDVAMDANAKRVAFDALGGYTATVKAIQSNGAMDAAAKAVAFDQQGQYVASVLSVVSSASMNADAKRVAFTGLGYYEAQVLATLQDPSKFDATAYSLAVIRQNDYMALVKAQLSGDATTQNLAEILKGTAGGNIVVNGSIVFDPNDPLKSIFNAIRSATEETSSYLKSISESTGALSASSAAAKFQAAFDALLIPLANARATASNAGAVISGENFASGTVGVSYAGSASSATNQYVTGLINAYRSAFDAAVAAYQSIPGHATGLANVPYDGYLMTAHAGEAVIDAGTMSSLRRYGISANQGAANDDLLMEVRALRAESVELRKEVVALRQGSSTDVKEQTARITAAVEDSAQSMGRTVARAAEAGSRA